MQVCFISLLERNRCPFFMGRQRTRCIPLRVARGPEEITRGMMFERSMDYALAFLYPDVSPRQMWMKNVMIPLDMVFCREGKIVQIYSDVPGCIPIVEDTECPIINSVPADLVLELPGGWSYGLRLQIGDVVVFSN
jgi:uncharacterized membrane protein (UPF0127 family)